MKLNRFERKILAAIVVVAAVPLLGAMILGQTVLHEAYRVGVNPQVRGQLEDGLAAQREHLVAVRNHAEQAAEAVSRDYGLRAAIQQRDPVRTTAELERLLQRYPVIARLRILDGDTAQPFASAGVEQRLAGPIRTLDLERTLEGLPGPPRAEVICAASMQDFLRYQQAGELVEVYKRLEARSAEVSRIYLLVFLGFMLSVIAIAIAVAAIISRRVTRRVALLVEATQRVGAGDLSVRLPSDANDEIGELTGSFNDMVRDMRESRGRIEYLQRIGAWQEFARRLAHEIKNPLTPIQLAVQELHQSYDRSDAAFASRLDDAHAIVREEVATLRRLVGEFSDFARLPRASLEPAELQTFLADAARSVEALAEEYRPDDSAPPRVVHCEPGGTRLPVAIDEMMLRRGVDNLVRNALEAMRGSERPGEVRLRTRREGNLAVLEVFDNGPGIPEPDRARIFDPYFTTKPDGTGLGLAIVKKVVLEHGGEILCGDSDLGGVRFVIRLPLATSTKSAKTRKAL